MKLYICTTQFLFTFDSSITLFASTQFTRYSYIGLIILILSILIAFGQIPVLTGLILLPFAAIFFYYLFQYPIIGIYTCLLFAFIANGLSRYVDAPLGISIDFFLSITLIATFFKRFETKNWDELKNPIVAVTAIWVMYCLFELFNPEVASYEAWVYAVRSPAFYLLFTIILGLLYFKDFKETERLIHIWLIFSVVAALYAMKQFYIGLDEAESKWLSMNASTHLLYGNLRVFSFY